MESFHLLAIVRLLPLEFSMFLALLFRMEPQGFQASPHISPVFLVLLLFFLSLVVRLPIQEIQRMCSL